MNTKVIALYLPQYHPISENDQWYGKGFTEWTSVARARPLFWGHYQPRVPADLGFYDLRLKESRVLQSNMALNYGVDAFCYWHYWFGKNKRLLEYPFNEMLKDKDVKIKFCLGWANHSWEKKLWDKTKKNDIIVEQEYLGVDDYTSHFYDMLDAFKDDRYLKVAGKLFFLIHAPLASDEISIFIKTWRKLASKNKLPGFYFVGGTSNSRSKDEIIDIGFDSIYNDNTTLIHRHLTLAGKVSRLLTRKYLGVPTKFKYSKAKKYFITKDSNERDVIPVIAPNWDHSPRSGRNSIILTKSTPKLFGEVLKDAFEVVSNKPEDERVIIIKSWNEWGEGNHLEPDLKFGTGYLEEIKKLK